jgi:endoribonuclease Nob1
MSDEVYVLDASAIIGGFIGKKIPNFTTSQVLLEIKDLKSQLTLQSALEDGLITIKEPAPGDIKEVEEVMMGSGDLLRLSDEDKGVVSLAVNLKKDNKSPTVVTDDYSMQNVLKIIGIPYKSVLTRGIEGLVGWVKFCKGCKKRYPPDYDFAECEICGSPISRKRIKKR